jgi:hypothetical protein
LYEIKPERQLELLRWLISFQDAQWLVKTSAVLGGAEALKLNSKVRNALGKTEMKAVLALVGKSKADNLADAFEILKTFLNLAYGERGWRGEFRLFSDHQAEIEVSSWLLTDNLRKATNPGIEAFSFAVEALWNNWFEMLLPDTHVEISSMLSGTNGRTSDLFSITCFSEAFAIPPQPAVVNPTVPESNSVAAALQIPLDDEKPGTTPVPAANTLVDYTTYTPPLEVRHTTPVLPTEQFDSKQIPPPAPMQGGTLSQRLANKRIGSNEINPEPSHTNEKVPANIVPLYDPNEARPLYSVDLEQKTKDAIGRSELKRNKLLQKLFLSKEARELLENAADEAIVPAFNLAAGIEGILQSLIIERNSRSPGYISEEVHVIGGANGDLQILVGKRVFSAVSEVPPGHIRELLNEAVARWGESAAG